MEPFVPAVLLFAGDAARQFQSRHRGQGPRFGEQNFSGRAVGRHHAAQRAHFANVQHERARIHIPKNRNVVPHQIVLRGFARTPVGSDRGKFPDDERLDVRERRLLIIDIRSHVSDVGISQADNLARVTRIGENFLISGEAGIENDFAAAPGDRSRRAAHEKCARLRAQEFPSVLLLPTVDPLWRLRSLRKTFHPFVIPSGARNLPCFSSA